ncbi:MAG: murein biosynthesis integral membrane protein MurJ [Candidatus Aminicenantes bacterium]|nr:murein biosynthesis integral membrane protein MurJ [Candidatus Aminicenantes bacterium]
MADIAKGVRSFTIGTAISRVLGLVREQVFAYLFGAGTSTDAFNAAFRIPNLLRDLFAENALSAAFVPVLTDQKKKGREAENVFASNILNTLLLVVGAVSLAGIFLSPWLARFIVSGFQDVPGKIALTGNLTAILFPFLLLIALAAWAMGVLNTEGAFFIPSLAPALFNVFSILVPLALFAYYTGKGGDPIYGMAIGVTVGGLMQLLVQVPLLHRKGFRYRFCLSFKSPEFHQAMALFVPVAIGLSGSRINVFVNTLLISRLEERSMTWLNYAFRIQHLPLGLFGIAVGTVALPALSRFVAEGRTGEVRTMLFDSLKMVLFLTLPTSALIAFLANPITSVIYEHGRFRPEDTIPVAQILVLYMIGVPFISALRNVAAVFYASKDARAPMFASFASVGVNIVLNLALMRVLGYRAFPLSATIAAVVNILILFLILPKKIGAFDQKPLLKYAGLMSAASLLCGGAAAALFFGLRSIAGRSFFVDLSGVVLCGSAGLLIFYALCRVMGLDEVRSYVKRFARFR